MSADAWSVFGVATATALATGVGAFPFVFLAAPARRWRGMSNAIAAGFMLGASAGLLAQRVHAPLRLIAGAAAGAGAIVVARRALGRHEGSRSSSVVGVMTAHSFAEGIALGVAFGDGAKLGLVLGIAIAVHNIPEGLAISLVLVPRGARPLAAAGWSVFSSLPQPLMALPAFGLVAWFEPLLPVGLGFAAGAMLWMVGTELAPDAVAEARLGPAILAAAAAAAAMLAFQVALGL